LTISFIGYKTVETVINGHSNTGKMYASSQDLNEVVVVRYGNQKKVLLTGAISGIKASAKRFTYY
jgi:hypothetical protein